MSNSLPQRYICLLGGLFLVWASLLAISPLNREAWLLENILVLIGLLILVFTRQRFQFSRLSYTLIFLFLCLHEIGSHYTYAKVPYDAWCRAIFGHSLNDLFGWERNHFDRLVHFLYGLLLTYPVREIVLRIVNARGLWGYLLPLGFTMSTSLVYEQIEWGVAIIFGGDLGMAYLGTQGDIWDSHQDALMATIGALIAMAAAAGVNVSLQRDFAREWAESLRVKQPEPLGEEAIKRMLQEKDEIN